MMIRFSNIAAQDLAAVKDAVPLVHVITNYVTMGWVADVLSAVGASPIMADAPGEVEEVVALADALVINIGTLNPARLENMLNAGRQAAVLEKPVVLDPVGAGALSARTDAALKILDSLPVSVIRANASEMLALSGRTIRSRGVDTAYPVEAARTAAGEMAGRFGLTAVVTGTEDLVVADGRDYRSANGHPLMGRVSGTGCAAGALVGAFLAIDPDPLTATLSAMACFNLAGEMAAETAPSYGRFKMAMLDALDTLTPVIVQQGASIHSDNEDDNDT